MHVNTKKMAVMGVLAAFAVLLLVFSSVIETNSLFLITAAAFCIGIVIREWGIASGAVFLAGSFLLGMIVAPNRLYCLTFLMMGIYLLLSEVLWGKIADAKNIRRRTAVLWAGRYVIFNCLFLPVLFLFPSLLFGEKAADTLFLFALIGGEAALFVFEKAYVYFQVFVWGKLRGKLKI